MERVIVRIRVAVNKILQILVRVSRPGLLGLLLALLLLQRILFLLLPLAIYRNRIILAHSLAPEIIFTQIQPVRDRLKSNLSLFLNLLLTIGTLSQVRDRVKVCPKGRPYIQGYGTVQRILFTIN
jgi:hypothetical protein